MKHVSRAALTLLAVALLAAAPAALAEVWRNHFDADAASRAPAFFDFEVLGTPGKANWMVVADHNPPSAPNQLTQTVAEPSRRLHRGRAAEERDAPGRKGDGAP